MGGDVSSDEVMILLTGLAGAVFLGARWYLLLARPSLAPYPGQWRTWLGLAPLVGVAGVLAVMLQLAARDVREAPQYLLLYTAAGACWIFGAGTAATYLGISARDDAVERRNRAAAIIIISVMISQAAIYAGANVGDGPGWWVILVSGSLALGFWLVLALVVEAACHVREHVTVDRDAAVAARHGGYLLGSALICARGAAGDWTSFERTFSEFIVIWPAVVLTGLAILVEQLLRGQRTSRNLAVSVLLALVYVALGFLAVAASPPLAQNPAYDVPPFELFEILQ